jgi:hypothetical protein
MASEPPLAKEPPIKNWKKKMNDTLNPITAKPATPNPITVPPVKETCKALAKDVRAACVVLTFAFVAIRIPIFPAIAENNEPKTKAGTINQ